MRVLTRAIALGVAAALAGCASVGARSPAEVAGRLSRAVEHGDAPGVRALTVADEAWARAEREAWLAGVRADAPAAFELSLAGDARASGEGAVAPVRLRWQGGADGETSEIEFPARFVRSGEAWRFAGPAWAEAGDGRFRVLVLPGAAGAPRVTRALARAVLAVDAVFGSAGEPVPVVTAYPSGDALRASVTPTYDAPADGWHDPGESIRVVLNGGVSDDGLAHVLAHELAHARHFAMVGERDATPWWVYEGVAELASERVVGGFDRVEAFVRRLGARGGLARFEDLAEFDPSAYRSGWVAYPQGHHMVRALAARHGDAALLDWLRRLGRGESLESASRGAFGRSFESIEREWRGSLEPQPASAGG